MRGSKAKLLRRMAEAATVGKAATAYTLKRYLDEGKTNYPTYVPDGVPINLGGGGDTVALVPGCTREVYLKLKKQVA